MKNKNVEILVGPPGSGKSYYINYDSGYSVEDTKVISSDDTRSKLAKQYDHQVTWYYEKENIKELHQLNNEVFKTIREEYKKALLDSIHRNIIIDATNMPLKHRRFYYEETKNRRYSDSEINVNIMVFFTPIELCFEHCIDRSLYRNREPIPLDAILNSLSSFNPPIIGTDCDSFEVHKTGDNIFFSNIRISMIKTLLSNNRIWQTQDSLRGHFNPNDYKYNFEDLAMNVNCFESTLAKDLIFGSQKNPYHKESLKEHVRLAIEFLNEYTGNTVNEETILAYYILLFHDLGKMFTRSYDKEKDCYHFYSHENVSAYFAMVLIPDNKRINTELSFENRTYYDLYTFIKAVWCHMLLHFNGVDWKKQREKCKLDDYQMGILKLVNECDLSGRTSAE